MAAPTREEIASLHRYWIRANLMCKHFQQELIRAQARGGLAQPKIAAELHLWAYMDYWYSALFVTIEGYRKLKLRDKDIDRLLSTTNMSALKEHRHATYHFNSQYFNSTGAQLVASQGSAEWVTELHNRLGQLLLDAMNVHNAAAGVPTPPTK